MTPNKLVVLLKKKLIFWRSYCIYLVLCIWSYLAFYGGFCPKTTFGISQCRETQAKNGQILRIKHIEAIEIYKTDHYTKCYRLQKEFIYIIYIYIYITHTYKRFFLFNKYLCYSCNAFPTSNHSTIVRRSSPPNILQKLVLQKQSFICLSWESHLFDDSSLH